MAATRKGWPLFPMFFGLIGVMFVGILLFVYHKVQQNLPVMLDDKGQVVQAPARQ